RFRLLRAAKHGRSNDCECENAVLSGDRQSRVNRGAGGVGKSVGESVERSAKPFRSRNRSALQRSPGAGPTLQSNPATDCGAEQLSDLGSAAGQNARPRFQPGTRNCYAVTSQRRPYLHSTEDRSLGGDRGGQTQSAIPKTTARKRFEPD